MKALTLAFFSFVMNFFILKIYLHILIHGHKHCRIK
nr:MAG TPA: hypothetical protein [Caudoviricetes sp.]